MAFSPSCNLFSTYKMTNQSPLLSLEFDPKRLDERLRQEIPALHGTMHLERITGGQSNPTFFVSYDNRRMVLRKKPPGQLLPSAHAVDREYRILAALAKTDVPVPPVIAFVGDAAVVGTPFYVMGRVEGRVFADPSLPGVSPEDRTSMFMSMADTLVGLHSVDWKAIGLSDFGQPEAYYPRQLERWSRQWKLSRTRDLPEIEQLIDWLASRLPANAMTSISHGDFRIGNLMFHPTQPRVVAVLDWELSTLGHPLADLAFSALAWHLDTNQYMGMKDRDLSLIGVPPESAYLARYYQQLPMAGRLEPFHYAFALFRLAVIFEGIAARSLSGSAVTAEPSTSAGLSEAFARIAVGFTLDR